MPKPIVFIAALLLALPAFAQTRMPAHQVEADTNMVNIAVSLPFTAQVALDWIDANWPALSSESWSNLDPAEDTVQSVFDWVDDNWPVLDPESWSFLSPESPVTVQSTFDWIDAYMGIDTNGWGYLAPTASTAQATFTWLDERFSGFDPGAVIMPGSNIVGGTLVSNQWTGLMPGTNIVGGALISNQWTGLMPGTNITGFALNDETSSWDPIETELAGYSMVPLFDVWSTERQAGAGYVWTLATAYEGVFTNAPDSGFNPSTGVFTAPQTGYYYFVAVGQFWAAEGSYAGLGLADSSAERLLQGNATGESSSYPYSVDCCITFASSGSASSGSLFKYMEANDTMCLWFRASTGFTNWYKAFQGFALR